jgi:uncharacterized membrane protein
MRDEPRVEQLQRSPAPAPAGATQAAPPVAGPAPPFVPWVPIAQLILTALLALAAEAVALGAPAGQTPAGLEGTALSVARLILGLLAVLVLPGFALSVLLFPRPQDADAFERAALTVGLSVVQLPLLVLALDRGPWGLTVTSTVTALVGATCGWCLLATLRVVQLAGRGAGGTGWPAGTRRGQRRGRPTTRLEGATLLAGAALAGVTVLALLTIVREPSLPRTTEFAVLGQGGLAEDYPRSAAPGEPVQVAVMVTNREGQPAEYQAVARLRGQDLARTPPLRLESGETWNGTLELALREYGLEQRVELLLLRGTAGEPYRRLQLVIDAPVPGEPTPVRAAQTPVPRR